MKRRQLAGCGVRRSQRPVTNDSHVNRAEACRRFRRQRLEGALPSDWSSTLENFRPDSVGAGASGLATAAACPPPAARRLPQHEDPRCRMESAPRPKMDPCDRLIIRPSRLPHHGATTSSGRQPKSAVRSVVPLLPRSAVSRARASCVLIPRPPLISVRHRTRRARVRRRYQSNRGISRHALQPFAEHHSLRAYHFNAASAMSTK